MSEDIREDALSACEEIFGDYTDEEVKDRCPPSVQRAWEVGKRVSFRNAAFVCGGGKDPKSCPRSKEGKCVECEVDLEDGYGIGSGYGFGAYRFCNTCGIFYDFHADPEG